MKEVLARSRSFSFSFSVLHHSAICRKIYRTTSSLNSETPTPVEGVEMEEEEEEEGDGEGGAIVGIEVVETAG
jgi:hypothetical protein